MEVMGPQLGGVVCDMAALAVESCEAGPRGARWWDSKGEPALPLGERGEALRYPLNPDV